MSNRLPHLEASVRAAHKAVGAHHKAAATKALEAGAALVEAKTLLRHGQWKTWLAGAEIPERSAQRYMALARGGLETAIVADLGMAEAARLAGLGHRLWPKGERFHHAEGVDEEHFAEAIWGRRADGRIVYSARHVIGGSQVVCMRYPPISKPWLLGLFHDRFPALEEPFRYLSEDEAHEAFARIEAEP